MEQALRYELTNRIPELADEIYPTNAPETATKPYLVYARINTDKDKNYDGFTNYQSLSFMFSVMATRYGDMKSLTQKVEAFLMSMPRTSVGETTKIFVEDIDIRNISETYEHELKVNRGIIDFTIFF